MEKNCTSEAWNMKREVACGTAMVGVGACLLTENNPSSDLQYSDMVEIEQQQNMQSTLLLTPAPVLSMDDEAVREAISTLALSSSSTSTTPISTTTAASPRPMSIHVVTSALHSLPHRRIESTTYDNVVIVPESLGNLGFSPTSVEDLKGCVRSAVRLAREGGRVVVVGYPDGDAASLVDSARSTMVMLGLKGVQVLGEGKVVCGSKVGKKAAERIAVGGVAATAVAANGVVRIAGLGDEDGESDDDDLVDEEELLGATVSEVEMATMANEKAAGAAEGCGPTKKACANCTCGRAEGKVTKLTKEMIENPQTGGCGSCSLGDAFRCAGCPYRGLPAFKPGEKIVVPGDFLMDDL